MVNEVVENENMKGKGTTKKGLKSRFSKMTICSLLIGGLGFSAGMLADDTLQQYVFRSRKEVQKGFYKKPYDLKINVEENNQGKLEVYLEDMSTDERYKINEDMQVGDASHLVKGLYNETKDYLKNISKGLHDLGKGKN